MNKHEPWRPDQCVFVFLLESNATPYAKEYDYSNFNYSYLHNSIPKINKFIQSMINSAKEEG